MNFREKQLFRFFDRQTIHILPLSRKNRDTFFQSFDNLKIKVSNCMFIYIGSTLASEPQTCADIWHTRGVEAIHTCWCCCHSNSLDGVVVAK